MPDAVTVACTSAAAAAASACGLPPDVSLLAALGGAAVSTLMRHSSLSELTLRVAMTIAAHVVGSAGLGLVAGAWWGALIPPWIASGSAPGWLAGAAVVPAWSVVAAVSGTAHVLIPLAARVLRKFVGGVGGGGAS